MAQAAESSSASNAWVESYLNARKSIAAEIANPGGKGCGILDPLGKAIRPACIQFSLIAISTHRMEWANAAVLSFGLSSEYAGATSEAAASKAADLDRSLYSKYYVTSLLKLDEDALKNAWSKVSA
jgi:hypothetical protein